MISLNKVRGEVGRQGMRRDFTALARNAIPPAREPVLIIPLRTQVLRINCSLYLLIPFTASSISVKRPRLPEPHLAIILFIYSAISHVRRAAECDFIYFAFLLSFRAAQNHFDH